MKIVHLLRKPLSEKTVASNVVKHGCGGLNIDASRIGTSDSLNGGAYAENPTHRAEQDMWTSQRTGDTNCFRRGKEHAGEYEQPTGRWPANVILQHLDGCRCEGVKRVKGQRGSGLTPTPARSWKNASVLGINRVGHAEEDGMETVAHWICVEGCPVARLDEQSGDRSSPWVGNPNRGEKGGHMFGGVSANPSDLAKPEYRDSGGASRFFKQVGGNEGS